VDEKAAESPPGRRRWEPGYQSTPDRSTSVLVRPTDKPDETITLQDNWQKKLDTYGRIRRERGE